MDAIILNDIPFKVDFPALLQRLHMADGTDHSAELQHLVRQAEAVGRPKAMYKEVPVQSKADRTVTIEGVQLTSQILRVNLDKPNRVFPFVTTCGTELNSWARDTDNVLHSFWVDQIRELGLRAAINHMRQVLADRHGLANAQMMNPGSLADWPLKEQGPLFRIVGDPAAAIGVQLTPSWLMVPIKSASGVLYAGEGSYENCMLCRMDNCPGRWAPYDPNLYDQRYRPAAPVAVGPASDLSDHI